jgi:acyl-CoA thioesterase FadM
VKEGVDRFLELFKQDPGDRQVIVTGRLGGIDTWRPEFPALPRGRRFLENVRFFQPGVEVVARTHLTLERDAYLADHEYKDVYLFPTVFGVEAMAQTVAYVLGRPELRSVTISDLDLSRPLPVHAERGLEIEVYARVVEGEPGAVTVKTGIRCEQNGFSVDHFSGTYSLGVQTAQPAGVSRTPERTAVLPLDPLRDLYGPILFQGARFQRIARVHQLDSDDCYFDSDEREATGYVLGDPFCRDTLLQSLQLCATPDQCLPVRIGRWQITDAADTAARIRHNRSSISARRPDEYVGNVTSSDVSGAVLEQVTEYHAKILERREDWPTAEELATGRTIRTDTIDATDWSASTCFYAAPGAGPRGQVVFVLRFPLTFRGSANPLRTAYFSNFAEWMGKARELSGIEQTGFHKRLFELFGSDVHGGVTNSFETTVFGRAGQSDVIEGHFWMEECSETEYTVVCDWRRLPFPSGTPERIARSKMRTSSVEILGPNEVKTAHWPEEFYRFLVGMNPSREWEALPESLPEGFSDLDLGEALWSTAEESEWPTVARRVFSTSLQDSNLVGNLYFGNYSSWQGRLRDEFFHALGPEYFNGRKSPAQLECISFGTQHLREAMPFDQIEATMQLRAIYPGAVDLWFDFHRVDSTGSREKLAVGHHRAALVSATGDPLQVLAWTPYALRRLFELVGTQPTTDMVRESA